MWKTGDPATFAFLIEKGEFEVKRDEDEDEDDYTAGSFIGEFAAIVKGGGVCGNTCKAVANSTIYYVEQDDLSHFLHKNPKLLVLLSSLDHIE